MCLWGSLNIKQVRCNKRSRSGTGLSFLLNCGSKLMRFFSAIAKLASFQVICSNVNPDTTADVEKRVVDKKNC